MATAISDYLLLEPNWASPLSLKKKWFTGIQSSLTNVEKRSAVYTWPRRTLSYNISSLSYELTAYLHRVVFKNIGKILGIPYWQDETSLSGEAASGQKVLPITSTLYRNFEVGCSVILFSSISSYEVGVISSFTDTQITVVGNLTSTWPVGTRVFPILKARIDISQNLLSFTDQYRSFDLEAVETYDELTRRTASISSFSTYQGHPILDSKPNWISEVGFDIMTDTDILSFFGKSQSYAHWSEAQTKHKSVFLGENKEEIQKIVDFFDYHKGRWGGFWRPSWLTDIQITAAASAGAYVLTITDISFASYWLGNQASVYIMLNWPNGSYEIKGIGAASGTSISLDSVLSNDILEVDLPNFMISFLVYSRFSQDEIVVEYITDAKADIQLYSQSTTMENAVPEIIFPPGVYSPSYLLYSTGRNTGYTLLREGSVQQNDYALIDEGTIEFIDVSLGNANALFIKSNGMLCGIGNNESGQFGTGDKAVLSTLTEIMAGCTKCVCSSSGSNFVIKDDGTLWACGKNTDGELGLGDNTERLTFTQVSSDSWLDIAAGYYAFYAIRSDGIMFSCGNGGNSNLGLGNSTTYNTLQAITDAQDTVTDPVALPVWAKVQASGGSPFVLAITSTGELFACGNGMYGKTCLDVQTSYNLFTARGDGPVWDSAYPGVNHSVALKADGTLWTAGAGYWGPLGHGDYNNQITLKQVGSDLYAYAGAAYQHTAAIKTDGTGMATGLQQYGALGIDTVDTKVNVMTAVVGVADCSKIVVGTNFAYIMAV